MPLIINGRPIDDSVLDAEFSQIKSYHERMSNVSCCERDSEFRQTARENVVGRVLLTEEAVRAIETLVDDWFDTDHAARAFIWVTHDPGQAARVGRRQLAMQSGRLAAREEHSA